MLRMFFLFGTYHGRSIKVDGQQSKESDAREGAAPDNLEINGSQTDSKLELFGFDSLVNILGLRRLVACSY